MTGTEEITNSQDFIDSRDIIERIDYLESLDTNADDLEQEELRILNELTEQASSSPDWKYGETLIRDSYFTEYARETCEDIGDIPKDLPWYIEKHIDWDGVAKEIQMDYTSVDFDGVDYWIRS